MWTEDKLESLLTAPSDALAADLKKLDGDIMILGAGGKMGPSQCILAKKAAPNKRIIAVSRFSDANAAKELEANGVETIACDLTNDLNSLPEVKNIVFMAGLKFGTSGNEWKTWGMNAVLPSFVSEKFKNSNIVVFSSGNIYPIVSLSSGGCVETDAPGAIGEYAQSVLARERVFEYASRKYGTKVLIFRLSYAVDLRYGVLYDMAKKIMTGEPVSLTTPALNCIWQGSANEYALRSLLKADAPASILNITGPETVSVRRAAETLGRYLGKEPVFTGTEGNDAYLNNAQLAMETFGYPSVSLNTLLRWQAEWIKDGGRGLNKPTHFEERKGAY